jgi:hypothetical protein
VGRTIERSPRHSRPPSPILIPRREADTQTGDNDRNPASCNEIHEPRRYEDDRLDRMEHVLGRMRESQLQEVSRRKRARRGRNSREKRRRKADVFADDTQGNGPIWPVDLLVVSEAWEPIPLIHDRVLSEKGKDDRGAEEGGLDSPNRFRRLHLR